MERHVSLDGFNGGLEFPEALQAKISYDPKAGRLTYRGVMYKADFDRLVQVHSSWTYRRALEELFRICTEPEETPRRRFGFGRIFRPLAEAGASPR